MLLIMLVSLGLIATFQQAQVARSARELRVEALEAEARLIAGRVVRTIDGSIRIAAVPAGRFGHRWVVRDESGKVLVAFGEPPETLPLPNRELVSEQVSPVYPGIGMSLRDLSAFAVAQVAVCSSHS